MANTNAPFGFRYTRRLDGSPPNYGFVQRLIASANQHATFTGDVMYPDGTGYVDLATPGVTQIMGIAVGFSWNSISYGGTIYRPYWPGNGDANGDVTVDLVIDPLAVFSVQAGATNLAFNLTDANVQFVVGTGNTSTGISGATVTTAGSGNTDTLPFRVVNTIVSNTDTTAAYNVVEVAFNFQSYRTLTGVA